MKLIEWMKTRDVTVDEVAARCQVSAYAVSKLTSGYSLPTVKAWEAIRVMTEGRVTADDFYLHRRERETQDKGGRLGEKKTTWREWAQRSGT